MKIPGNFGEVLEGVFRGAWPTPENLNELRERGIRTVVTLYSQAGDEPEKAEELGSQILRAGMFPLALEISDRVSLLEAAVRVLTLERDVYLHCLGGANRAGLVSLLVQIFFARGNGRKVGEQELAEMLAQAAAHGFDFDKPYSQIMESLLRDLSRQGVISRKEDSHVFPNYE